MQILIQGAIGVANAPDGGKVIQIKDGAGNEFMIPLTQEAARSVSAALSTSLLVAGGPLPPMPINQGNGHS